MHTTTQNIGNIVVGDNSPSWSGSCGSSNCTCKSKLLREQVREPSDGCKFTISTRDFGAGTFD
jgi:hypothetical protein